MTSFMQRALMRVRPNESLRQIVTQKASDRRLLLRYLHDFNANAGLHGETESLLKPRRRLFGERENFFQLPCCAVTRRKRAIWMIDRGLTHKAILLLGDDDLLAVELCKRGFTNVTVADCDPRVLKEIDRRCRSFKHMPLLLNADFSQPSFRPPSGMDVVVFDPPQNTAGMKVFFGAALRAIEGAEDPLVLMMLNPYAVGSTFPDFVVELAARGVVLRHHQPYFNAYPVYAWERFILRMALLLFHGYRVGRNRDLFFASDLFEFSLNQPRKEGNDA